MNRTNSIPLADRPRAQTLQRPQMSQSPSLNSNLSINSTGYEENNPPEGIDEVISNRNLNRFQTVYTTKDQHYQFKSVFNWPTRIFHWVYSFSLILIILFMLAFISVTPIDVIYQTLNATNAIAIKTFIVIAVCVVFIVVSIVIYFTRIYQNKMAMNDIPSKSIYVPYVHDYPKIVFKYIETNLNRCLDIARLCGPLNQKTLNINHPGLSPPKYIQERNNTQSLLPPNIQYEEVIRSLSDKFYTGKLLTEDEIPINLSVKEIITLVYKQTNQNDELKSEGVSKLISIYEKCRFSSQLITEMDLFEFMIEFDKFAFVCQNDYANRIPQKATRRSIHENGNNELTYYSSNVLHEDTPSTITSTSTSSNTTDDQSSISGNSEASFSHKQAESKYFENVNDSFLDDDNKSVKKLKLRKFSSFNSSRSVVRNRLALNSRNSLNRNTSGYMSDSEMEDKDHDDFELHDNDDVEDFYKFERVPGVLNDSPTQIVDSVEIRKN